MAAAAAAVAVLRIIFFKILFYLWRAFSIYASTIFMFPLFSVYQEHKIWASPGLISLSLWGHFKVYLFNVFWMGLCLLSTLVILLPKRIIFQQDNVQYESFMWCERWIAIFMVKTLVGNVEVRGQEHLPPLGDPGGTSTIPAPIYIANHESQLDLGVVYFLHRRWKWISKQSVLFLPGVGSIMYLSDHVFINRRTAATRTTSGTKKGASTSVANLYEKSNAAVQSGIAMFFFPQGTRKISERLPFKDGAFNVALQNKSPIICISIQIPINVWNRAYPLPVRRRLRRWLRLLLPWANNNNNDDDDDDDDEPVVLTVHPPIVIHGSEDKEALKKQCFDTIYSVLPDARKQD
jgi:1-acyl-sn-glycerol-3-phosphate acyltransferase